ncbi:unnamed protein product [Nezara viridula]|uniref:Uncharacterized protein n=1 Tax=Nezara viridula TaxID=85310 RepID=A0A9P0MWW3_NEZVI|nr:unnamed protein product [Nezara viridula]
MNMKIYEILLFVVGCCGVRWVPMSLIVNNKSISPDNNPLQKITDNQKYRNKVVLGERTITNNTTAPVQMGMVDNANGLGLVTRVPIEPWNGTTPNISETEETAIIKKTDELKRTLLGQKYVKNLSLGGVDSSRSGSDEETNPKRNAIRTPTRTTTIAVAALTEATPTNIARNETTSNNNNTENYENNNKTAPMEKIHKDQVPPLMIVDYKSTAGIISGNFRNKNEKEGTPTSTTPVAVAALTEATPTNIARNETTSNNYNTENYENNDKTAPMDKIQKDQAPPLMIVDDPNMAGKVSGELGTENEKDGAPTSSENRNSSDTKTNSTILPQWTTKPTNLQTTETHSPQFAYVIHVVNGTTRTRLCRVGRRRKW